MQNVFAFALLLGCMVLVHELGHFLMAKLARVRVDEFGIGFPPRLLRIRRGETDYTLNALPIGGFVRMLGEEDPRHPRSFARARKRWRVGILLAGSAMNFAAAALFFSVAYMAGWPTVTQTEVQINQVLAGSPAERSGLARGDVILSLGGQAVPKINDLRRMTDQSLGQPLVIEIRRAGAVQTLAVTPRTHWPEGEGPMGIAIQDRPTKVEPVGYPAGEATLRGARELARTVVLIPAVTVAVLQGLLPADILRPVGPVGLFQATSAATTETVRTGWWFPILSWAATLGVGLGLANLLPIPGLDGGRLLFVALEAVRGRRVSPEREGFIHLVGMAVLISMVVVISYFDVAFPLNVDFSLR